MPASSFLELSMDAAIWRNMFHIEISALEKIIRPALVYFFLIVMLRLAGKRELAQLNTFDLVVLLMLANTVQNAIIGSNDNSLAGGLLGAVALLTVNYVVVRFLYSHEPLDRFVEGEPVALIENGRIRHDRLKKEIITVSELEEAAHKQGFASLDLVDRAVLEPGGTVSFLGKSLQPEEMRYRELLQRLDTISRDVAALRGH
jgi:uncharacterized membrane protein YcaP (DUF421 family)